MWSVNRFSTGGEEGARRTRAKSLPSGRLILLLLRVSLVELFFEAPFVVCTVSSRTAPNVVSIVDRKGVMQGSVVATRAYCIPACVQTATRAPSSVRSDDLISWPIARKRRKAKAKILTGPAYSARDRHGLPRERTHGRRVPNAKTTLAFCLRGICN
jgi:hypothetical protein